MGVSGVGGPGWGTICSAPGAPTETGTRLRS